MKASTWEQLEKQFEEFPFMKAESVSEEEMNSIEASLGVRFDSDYKQFVLKYGGAIVSPFPIYGLRQAEPMDDELWSVSIVTMHYRNEGWPGTQDWYVISSDHADNPVGITPEGKVVSYDHDYGEMVDVAESFETYLIKCLGDS